MKKIIKKHKPKIPPVHEGDSITIVPTGIGAKDPYCNMEGFIIFIKGLSYNDFEDINKPISITITCVKPTFAFAKPNN